jgi:hypothetical protein
MGVRTVRFSTALALSLAAFFVVPSVAWAGWQEQISAADRDRLEHLGQIRASALNDAGHGAGQGDERAVERVMRPQGHMIPAGAMTGNWRCREIKLGGMTSYMVYSAWFRCSIRNSRGALVLEKVNGTQRFAGELFPYNGAWVYLGASSAKGEPRHRYSGPSAAIGASVTPDDQVGLLTGIGDNHLRLEMPAVQESLLDVVEFAR